MATQQRTSLHAGASHQVLTERVYEGDEGWLSHPDEVSPVLFRYNQSYTEEDRRVSYNSAK